MLPYSIAFCLFTCLSRVIQVTAVNEQWSKINIHPVYHSSVNSLSPQITNYIKCHIIDAAVSWLHEALSVEELSYPFSLLLDRECPYGAYITPIVEDSYCRNNCSQYTQCGPIPVESQYTKSCLKCSSSTRQCYKEVKNTFSFPNNTHFVLHVAAIPSRVCQIEGVVTEGGACQQNPINDRPVIGYLNICPSAIDRERYSWQLLHVFRDILESLAFSYKLLPFFRSPLGVPYMRRNLHGVPKQKPNGQYEMDYQILSDYFYANWTSARNVLDHYSKILKLPAIIREARKHFNCPTLEGVPLEDQSSGRLLWESRIMLGDIMTNIWLDRPVVSSITMALLEDSGWYKPDYHYAGVFNWGKDEGCDFIKSSCIDIMRKRGNHSFCSGKYIYGCTQNFSSVGMCSRQAYIDELPLEYQYFKFDSHVGGTVPLVDYCPIYNTPVSSTAPNDSVLSVYCTGEESHRCIEHHGAWNVTVHTSATSTATTAFKFGASCFNVACSKTLLKLSVGGQDFYCTHSGQILTVNISTDSVQYSGKLKCPPHQRFCHAYNCVNYCSGNGRCVEGFCYCNPGYYGVDCKLAYNQRYIPLCMCKNDYVLRRNHCGCYCDCEYAIYWGLSGYYCTEVVPKNRCTPKKCRGHGRCTRVNEGRGFRCICDPGYIGGRCDNCPKGYASRECTTCPSGWKCVEKKRLQNK